jgi:hypothetical protein
VFPETIKRELRCSLPIPDAEACLARMQRNGFQPKLVIDVGAYVDWTRIYRRIFPDESILMIEPQAATQSALQQIAAQGESISLARALLGKVHNSQVPLYEAQSGSSVLTEWEREGQQPTTTIDMTTLDGVTADTAFAMPDCLSSMFRVTNHSEGRRAGALLGGGRLDGSQLQRSRTVCGGA